jgi:hypothetical protein
MVSADVPPPSDRYRQDRVRVGPGEAAYAFRGLEGYQVAPTGEAILEPSHALGYNVSPRPESVAPIRN